MYLEWDAFTICIHSYACPAGAKGLRGAPTAPLSPLDSLTPSWPGLRPWTRGLEPKNFLARNEDAKRPRRRYRTRLWVRGLGGMWYFYRDAVRSAAPGLRWRFARPRPSGRMD